MSMSGTEPKQSEGGAREVMSVSPELTNNVSLSLRIYRKHRGQQANRIESIFYIYGSTTVSK